MTTDTIGFLGLGSMGGPITTRLASWAQRMPGKRILAYDPRPEALAAVVEAGAQPMRSVAEIAAHCPVVFACLASPEISEAVALGPDGITSAPGRQVTTYVEMSTIGSETIRRLAAGLAARGVTLIDAPISGGALGARTGELSVMASGAPEAVAAVMPALQVIGKHVFVVGDTAGQSQTMKLANNLLSLAGMVLASEALSLGAKAGIDTALMCDIINVSTGRNSSTVTKFPRAVLTGRYDSGSTTQIATKDMSLALAEFSALGLSAPMTSLAREMLNIAKNNFGASADMTMIAKLYENWAAVSLQSPNAPKRVD